MGQARSKPPAADGEAGRREWSDLPDAAIHEIAMRLSSPFAFSAFAGACRSWRSVAEAAKHDFISTQPPLLLTLAPSPSKRSQFRLYSVAENRSYMASSPFLATVLQNYFIRGHSHGCLIAFDRQTRAPALLNLATQETISLPALPKPPTIAFPCGLLTSPIDSVNCILLIYNCICVPFVAYCRVADPSKRWNKFPIPTVHGESTCDRRLFSVTHLEDRLYIGLCRGYVTVVDISRDPFDVVRVVEHPSMGWSRDGALLAQDGELISVTVDVDGSGCEVRRMELAEAEEGGWVDGLGAGRSAFVNVWQAVGYVWSGRMKGVEEKCV